MDVDNIVSVLGVAVVGALLGGLVTYKFQIAQKRWESAMEARSKLRDNAIALRRAYLGASGTAAELRALDVEVDAFGFEFRAFLKGRRWPWHWRFNAAVNRAADAFFKPELKGRMVDGQKCLAPLELFDARAKAIGAVIEML